MIQAVMGIGNPHKKKYKNTAHNLGLDAVFHAIFRRKLSLRYKNDLYSVYVDGDFLFVLSHVYMNHSGYALKHLIDRESFSPSDVLVCVDDFSIDFERVRIRLRGSHGGHNGLKSIIDLLQTQAVPRLRIGCGPLVADNKDDVSDFVLQKFPLEKQKRCITLFDTIDDMIAYIQKHGCERTMNQYN